MIKFGMVIHVGEGHVCNGSGMAPSQGAGPRSSPHLGGGGSPTHADSFLMLNNQIWRDNTYGGRGISATHPFVVTAHAAPTYVHTV